MGVLSVTAVAIWHEPTHTALWAVADTRISISTEHGAVVRTDFASKLFSLPVVCAKSSYLTDQMKEMRSSHTYGFAFAGDAVPALMTFATASTFLANLVSDKDAPPPSLREISEFVRKLGARFGLETAGSRNRDKIDLEIAVFGWCPVSKAFAIYSLTAKNSSDRNDLTLAEKFPIASDQITTLGSGGTSLLEEVERLRQKHSGHDRSSTMYPKLALQNLVRSNTRSDIGGSISIATVNRREFILLREIRPPTDGELVATVPYNGIEPEIEFGPIGAYQIGIPATP